MSKITRRGALEITATLDRIAQTFQKNHTALGIDQKIAMDFAYRCDLLSDAIEGRAKKAADDNSSILGDTGNNDPADIGEDVGGPLEMVDSHEPWMAGHFSQEKFHDLGDLQESGELGPVHLAKKLAALQRQVASLHSTLARLSR